MLKSLHISDYVIIRQSDIRFAPGLNMITGETGAGKSIILGAMGLILGNRADSQVVSHGTAKAVIEAVFDEPGPAIREMLAAYDLDVRDEVVMRREITTAGRSRAFVNDTPVTLEVMSEVGAALVDVHQQFDTLEIRHAHEQYALLDAYCHQSSMLAQYQQLFDGYSALQGRLDTLRAQQAVAIKEKDYLTFQLEEFAALHLQPGEIVSIEEEYALQSGAEELKTALASLTALLTGEQGLEDSIKAQIRALSKAGSGNSQVRGIEEKLISILEISDALTREISVLEDRVDPDPHRRQQLEEKLNAINKLMLKHGARNEAELDAARTELETQLLRWKSLDEEIARHETELIAMRDQLTARASALSAARGKGAPKLARTVTNGLKALSMKHAIFSVEVKFSGDLHRFGSDDIAFLFAANAGSEPRPIRKVASGGELSRLNLCLKSAVSDQMALPTLVFDEIDAGVSGEVAMRMGQMLRTLAGQHQVIMITHSPQIAAQAGHHLRVAKADDNGRSIAHIEVLKTGERVIEIAKMLSGDPPTEAAMMNARELMESTH